MSVRSNSTCPTHQLVDDVRRIVASQPVWDVHTHLYSPAFGSPLAGSGHTSDPNGLLLWGVDELLTYHYLVAEVFRVLPTEQSSTAAFWKMTKRQQADLIWQHLFTQRAPLSEACRGVVTTLAQLGLDPNERSLDSYRRWFAAQDQNQHIDRVMELAGVERIVMTNNVFDDNERNRWLNEPTAGSDPRFVAVLRFDPLLRDWASAAPRLSEWGYEVDEQLNDRTVAEVQRFLTDWIDRLQAVYCAASLPPEFRYDGCDDRSSSGIMLREIILPLLADRGLPLAMMIGSTPRVNPDLDEAGDMVGKAEITTVTQLCAEFPHNNFLVTMLSRENQHELAVLARKFRNLMVFGCWWFLNTPSLVEEITQMRLELLGATFIPQHSDARLLEQLIYKWQHSRAVIADVLARQYGKLSETGWPVTKEVITADVQRLFRDNAASLLGDGADAS